MPDLACGFRKNLLLISRKNDSENKLKKMSWVNDFQSSPKNQRNRFALCAVSLRNATADQQRTSYIMV
jgi:hypothetical protein